MAYQRYQDKENRPSLAAYFLDDRNKAMRDAFENAASVKLEPVELGRKALYVEGATKEVVQKAMEALGEIADALVVVLPQQSLENALKKVTL